VSSPVETAGPRVLAANPPAEPAHGSVVLARDGIAWQAATRYGDPIWYSATGCDPWLRFVELLTVHGPLTVLHEAVAE
jgi:hypothetical protein